MKCPKCSYLGFETGDRCKHCGYDFSLVVSPTLSSDLPLFSSAALDDDQPLIKVPKAPRAPLAVRRTPDKPRLRAVPKAVTPPPPSSPSPDVGRQLEPSLPLRVPVAVNQAPTSSAHPGTTDTSAEPSGPGRRLSAGLIDHAILFAVDAAVIYFTLKMAALSPGEWGALPPVPLVAFLLMIKVAYFCAFTIFGGQTVGKMAARIRVVAENGRSIDPTASLRRTIAGAGSLVALGLGFVPVMLDSQRRAFHDRITHTRVVVTGRDR